MNSRFRSTCTSLWTWSKASAGAFLERMLRACAMGPAFIEQYLKRIRELDARASDAISVTGRIRDGTPSEIASTCCNQQCMEIPSSRYIR